MDGVTLVNQKGDRIGTSRLRQRVREKERIRVETRRGGGEKKRERERPETFSRRRVSAGERKRGAACGPRFSYLSFPDAYVLLGRAVPRYTITPARGGITEGTNNVMYYT